MNILYYIYNSDYYLFILTLISILFFFLFFTYLGDGKFSEDRYIRFLQYFMFSAIGIYIYTKFILPSSYCSSGEDQNILNDLSLKNKSNESLLENEELKCITKKDLNDIAEKSRDHFETVVSDGVNKVFKIASTAGTALGIGASVGGGMAAMKGIVKGTGLPLGGKIVVVAGGAVIGGLAHLGTAALHKAYIAENNIQVEESVKDDITSNPPSPTDSYFVSSSLEVTDNFSGNPIELLLNCILGLNIISLLLLIVLTIILISKIVINSNLELRFLSKLMSIAQVNSIRKYLQLYFKYVSKSSIFLITLNIIFIFIGLSFSIYFLIEFKDHLEGFCKVYLSYK